MISVVTINYNNSEGLKLTLDSLVNQTVSCSQLILVDGGSADGSMDVFSSYDLSNVSSVESISEPDGGLYDAMNKGLDRVVSDYVVFMNSGDCFADDHVLECVSLEIDRSCPDFIYGDYIEGTNEGFFYKAARNVLSNKKGMITSHQSMYFSKDMIKKNELKYQIQYLYAADYCFVSSFLCESKKNSYINKALCIFDASGVSNTNRYSALKENYKIRREVLKMGRVYCVTLYVAHYLHTTLKKKLPKVARWLRKSEPCNV
ncbi:glycosyltransferase [Amphritea pacifica]|uniref:Glycosyltransferase n=1 Tax=Amphritea pacifica TaxID=2811233 RepID=A0ABS2W7S4_9GAMM|nr:glycosyltransferase [Amphritea pacifica]MBN0987767.1 glycosyltransferase [Amphritea pacifica]